MADDKVHTGPAPAWVKVLPLPAATVVDGGSQQILLIDNQTSFKPGGSEYYYETAYKVLNAQGLQDLGELAWTWDPLLETVTYHKAEVIRDLVEAVWRLQGQDDPVVGLVDRTRREGRSGPGVDHQRRRLTNQTSAR